MLQSYRRGDYAYFYNLTSCSKPSHFSRCTLPFSNNANSSLLSPPSHLLSLSHLIAAMELLLILPSAAAAVAAMLAIIFLYKSLTKPSAHLPRGTLGWPLIGETLEFISCAYSPCPESFMDKRRLQYGKVFKSHIFGGPTIVSTDAEVNKAVLQDGATFVPWYPKTLRELTGKSSILTINGSLQRRVHGLIGFFFKSAHFKALVTDHMQRYIRQSMANWKDGEAVYIQDETKEIVFQLLVKTILGMEPGEELPVIRTLFQEYIAGLMSLPVKLPGTTFYRSLQAKKKMENIVRRIMEEKRATNNECNSNPEDLVDVFINDTSCDLSEDMIVDNVIDLMIPAENSVPILVTLAIKYLSECPLALHYVEQENLRLRQTRARDQELEWSDYSSLSFTQNVISETLRLGNIITGIMRKATRDVEIKGHFIPKGWGVFTYFRSVHLDESLYEDPYTFNPWRWKGKETGTCGFSPFGGGQRLCPAMDLARLEATIFLHQFITQFTWEAEEDEIVSFPTVSMKGKLPVRVHRRKCDSLKDSFALDS